jgi:hypothetical protein
MPDSVIFPAGHDALSLMRVQAATLFEFDEQGRLVCVNEPRRPESPRIFIGRTRDGDVVHTRADLDAELAEQLDDLAGEAGPWTADGSAPRCAARLTELLEGAAPVSRVYHGPAYVFPARATAPGDAVSLSGERGVAFHPELLLRGWLPGEETPPYFGVVRDGQVVSVCYSARSGLQAAEAGVETATDYRGQGLAAIATAGWAAAVQRSGRLALYSTTWENAASQGVARKLGLAMYGEDWHVT